MDTQGQSRWDSPGLDLSPYVGRVWPEPYRSQGSPASLQTVTTPEAMRMGREAGISSQKLLEDFLPFEVRELPEYSNPLAVLPWITWGSYTV